MEVPENITRLIANDIFSGIVIEENILNPITLIFNNKPDNTVYFDLPTTLVKEHNQQAIYVEIPSRTLLKATENWDGEFLLPQVDVLDISNVNISVAVTMGSSEEITFSRPILIILPGEAGKKVGWRRGTGPLTEITTICETTWTPENINLISPRICKVEVSDDMYIYTHHLSTFVSYNEIPQEESSNQNGGNGGGGGGGGTTDRDDRTRDQSAEQRTSTQTDFIPNTQRISTPSTTEGDTNNQPSDEDKQTHNESTMTESTNDERISTNFLENINKILIYTIIFITLIGLITISSVYILRPKKTALNSLLQSAKDDLRNGNRESAHQKYNQMRIVWESNPNERLRKDIMELYEALKNTRK